MRVAEHEMAIELGPDSRWLIGCHCGQWHCHVSIREDGMEAFRQHLEISDALAVFTSTFSYFSTYLDKRGTDIVPASVPLKVRAIVRMVAMITGVPIEDIVGHSKKKFVVDARHLAFYLIRKFTHFSIESIGDFFGYHHTSVIYALQKFEARTEANSTLSMAFERCQQELSG